MINQNYMMNDYLKKIVENRFLLLGASLFCALSVAGYYFYFLYERGKQERAQLAFSQTIRELHQSEKNSELWPNAELAAKTGYNRYKSTVFGPYFLVLESQAALSQDNFQEGSNLLNNAVKQIGFRSPVYFVYAIKSALVKLDSEDVAMQNEGFKELEKLSYDKSNPQRDQALYYLGDYYMRHSDNNKALSVWQELKKDFSATQYSSASPWTLLVEERIH